MSTSSDAEVILDRMREVRADIRTNVEEAVENAQTMTDWRHYVTNYPWVCLGAATFLGYMLVPTRTQIIRPTATELAKLAKRQQLVVEPNPAPHAQPSMAQKIMDLALNTAGRTAVTLIGQQIGKMFAKSDTVQEAVNSDAPR